MSAINKKCIKIIIGSDGAGAYFRQSWCMKTNDRKIRMQKSKESFSWKVLEVLMRTLF